MDQMGTSRDRQDAATEPPDRIPFSDHRGSFAHQTDPTRVETIRTGIVASCIAE